MPIYAILIIVGWIESARLSREYFYYKDFCADKAGPRAMCLEYFSEYVIPTIDVLLSGGWDDYVPEGERDYVFPRPIM